MTDAAHEPMHTTLIRDAIPIAGEPLVLHVDASRNAARQSKAPKKPQRGKAIQGIDHAAIELSRIVGARARDIRLAKGLSLETMFKRGAPTASTLSQIERGITTLTAIQTLATIAKALDVAVFQLFYSDEQGKTDDALFIAANVDAFDAKRLLFLIQEGTAMESKDADGIV
jgi:transcriptional regulator with XRE-family HTH domain